MDHDNDASEMNHEGMNHSSMHDHSGMPGMLTQEQLEELALAKGTDFDRLLLNLHDSTPYRSHYNGKRFS